MTQMWAGQFERGAEGRWYLKSPVVDTVLMLVRFFEPKPGTIVRGLWLGADRENELAVPALPEHFDQMASIPSSYLWTHGGRVHPEAVVSLLITGDARAIAATFRTRTPRSLPSPLKDPDHA